MTFIPEGYPPVDHDRVSDEQYERLRDMRGGCTCFASPPCNACVDPVTWDEMEDLELPLTQDVATAQADLVGIDYSAITRRLCG